MLKVLSNSLTNSAQVIFKVKTLFAFLCVIVPRFKLPIQKKSAATYTKRNVSKYRKQKESYDEKWYDL